MENNEFIALNRQLKRVPLDFDWPLNETWIGYQLNFCRAYAYRTQKNNCCKYCREVAEKNGYKMLNDNNADDGGRCPEFPRIEPPMGEGYQCWETIGESPWSPVFKTYSELRKWIADNPNIIEVTL